MFVEFTNYYDQPISVNPNKVIYVYKSDSNITWIVFGEGDFEIRVKNPYKYVMEQLSKSKQED